MSAYLGVRGKVGVYTKRKKINRLAINFSVLVEQSERKSKFLLYQGSMLDLTWNHAVKTVRTDLSILLKILGEKVSSNQNILLYHDKCKYTMELKAKSCLNFKEKRQDSKKIEVCQSCLNSISPQPPTPY